MAPTKTKAWLETELGKALAGWDEAMLQFLVESVAASTKRSEVDEVVQNFLPGEPKAIAILDAYFGSKPAPAAAGAAAHASSERSTGSTAAGNGSAGAGSAGAQDQQAPDGMRQYHKGSSGPDVTEYRAANEAKLARPAERSSPAQPTKVLGMFNEGGRLRPSTGAVAGAGGGGAGGGGKKQQEKLTAATLERPVVNCLGCGKIYDCRSVTSDIARFLDKGGVCTFCGDKVGLTYQERAEQLSRAAAGTPDPDAADGQAGSKDGGAAAAVEFKNRLVEYDRNAAKRTTVIDDQSDYFEIDTNAWLTDQERSELRRRRQLEEEAAAAKRNKITVTIDLIGRKVVVPDALPSNAASFETSTDMAAAREEAAAAAAAAKAKAAEAEAAASSSARPVSTQPKATAEAVLKASEQLRTMKMTVNPHFASAFLPSSTGGVGGNGASSSAGPSGGRAGQAAGGGGAGASSGGRTDPNPRGKAGQRGGGADAGSSSSKGPAGSGAGASSSSNSNGGLSSKPQRLQGDLFEEFEEFGLEVLYEDAMAAAAAAEAVKPFDICEPQMAYGGVAPLRSSKPATMASKLHNLSSTAKPSTDKLPTGMVLLKGYLSVSQQAALVSELRALGTGPGGFYTPTYSSGGQLHLRMMCLGWHWEPRTHSYERTRSSFDGAVPPLIPDSLMQLVPGIISAVDAASGFKQPAPFKPDVCLVNFYEGTGKLGYHQDKDESSESLARGLPVLSISIGDSADMLYGEGPDESAARSVRLESGDVLVFGGPARMLYHAVPHIYPGTAPPELLQATGMRPGRLNLTLRQIWA